MSVIIFYIFGYTFYIYGWIFQATLEKHSNDDLLFFMV